MTSSVSVKEGWARCQKALQSQISGDDDAGWLQSIELSAVDESKIVLQGIPNAFLKQRIRTQFKDLILITVRLVFSDIHFLPEVDLQLKEAPSSEAPAAPLTAEPLKAELSINPKHLFETFVCLPENQITLSVLKDISAGHPAKYNPITLVSGAGMGKTHLVQALYQQVSAQSTVFITSGESFKQAVLGGMRCYAIESFREKVYAAQCLIIDDLEALLLSPRSQEECVLGMDHFLSANKQIVITAQQSPMQLKRILPSLQSRLSMGLISDIVPLDLACRLTLLEVYAKAAHVVLDNSAAKCLAERIENPRSLQGAVMRLSVYGTSKQFDQSIVEPLCKDLMVSKTTSFSIETILKTICDNYSLKITDLRSRKRTLTISEARAVAAYFLRQQCRLSHAEIGELLGSRHASTIIKLEKNIAKRLRHDVKINQIMSNLKTL